MRACMTLGLAVGLTLSAGAVMRGSDADSKALAERVARLIEQLGDRTFKKREAAARELEAIGEPALPALRLAASSGDPERCRRAEQVVQVITGRLRAAAASKDLEKLQGTWYTISVVDGNTVTGEDRTDTITYQGDRYVQRKHGAVWAAGTFRIVDATANPKQIEYTCTQGVFQGHFRSIYTLEGDDHHICSAAGNNNRPKEFSGKSGYLRVTRRVKQ